MELPKTIAEGWKVECCGWLGSWEASRRRCWVAGKFMGVLAISAIVSV